MFRTPFLLDIFFLLTYFLLRPGLVCGRREPPARLRWLSYTLAIETVTILFVYEIVRLRF